MLFLNIWKTLKCHKYYFRETINGKPRILVTRSPALVFRAVYSPVFYLVSQQINEIFEKQSTYNLYKTKINLHRIKPSELENFINSFKHFKDAVELKWLVSIILVSRVSFAPFNLHDFVIRLTNSPLKSAYYSCKLELARII